MILSGLVSVDANAFEDHSFVTINLFASFRPLFHALQEEVHTVLKRHRIVRILLEVERLQSLGLPVIVINIL